nr:hypothetical protein [Tanacetum cinerariifolium]
MIAILEKYEHNADFHQIVDFVEAFHLMYALTINPTVYVSHIRQFWSTARIETTDEGTKILATVDGTPTKPYHTPSPEAPQISPTTHSSPSLPPVTAATIPTVIPIDIPQLRQYTRRARIAQSSTLPPVADEPASPIGDDSQELMDLCTHLQRQQDEMASKIIAQDLEISTLKARIKHLEDRDGGDDEPSGEDAIIKERSVETGEEAVIERKVTIVSVPPATISVPTGSDMVPTASLIFSIAIVATPYSRRKVLRSNVGWKTKHFKGMSLKEIREKFVLVWKQIIDFVPMGSKEEGKRIKRKGLRLEQESTKKVKTSEEVSEEDLKEMMHLVPVEEVYVEALQVKHLIIDWEIHTEGQRTYWKIIRLGGSTASYQFFVDLLKHFDREDLNQLWALVKETLNIRQATMEWRLYDTCRVHHVLSRDQEIFMLVEKEYPLRKGLAIVMISNKLQVENYSQKASDLIQKIYKIANNPRQRSIPTASDEFPLPEEVSTASEERFPLLRKRDATTEEDCTANEDKG